MSDERKQIEWAVETLDEAVGGMGSGDRHIVPEDAWEAWSEVLRPLLYRHPEPTDEESEEEETMYPCGAHEKFYPAPRYEIKLLRKGFTEEDLDHLDDAITTIVGRDGCVGVPGLAHVRNKIAARLGKNLITTGEEDSE